VKPRSIKRPGSLLVPALLAACVTLGPNTADQFRGPPSADDSPSIKRDQAVRIGAEGNAPVADRDGAGVTLEASRRSQTADRGIGGTGIVGVVTVGSGASTNPPVGSDRSRSHGVIARHEPRRANALMAKVAPAQSSLLTAAVTSVATANGTGTATTSIAPPARRSDTPVPCPVLPHPGG
jgi:hypothetical protein